MKNEMNWGILINPFTRIAGLKAFVIGIIIVILTVLIGYYNGICFPGVISTKIPLAISLPGSFCVQFIGLGTTVLVMYIISLVFAKNVRFQDILGTVTLSRFPFLIIALSGFINDISADNLTRSVLDGTFNPADYIGFLVFMILTIIIIIWSVAILYNAFRISTDIKSPRSIILFIGIVIISEILSTVVLVLIG